MKTTRHCYLHDAFAAGVPLFLYFASFVPRIPLSFQKLHHETVVDILSAVPGALR
jgi:hypothetical protein